MIKIGLLGCGFMGGTHSACYAAMEDVTVAAISDIERARAEKAAEAHGSVIYENAEELIRTANVDAIDICLPTYMHTHYALLAMENGKDVFLEKPVCLSATDGALLLATQKATGRRVMVGQVIRSWDEYMLLSEIIADCRYGKLLHAAFKRLSPYPTWGWKNWLHKKECSGSVALDMHVHDLDYMRSILGEPDTMAAKCSFDESDTITYIQSSFTFGKAAVSVECCWHYPPDFPFSMEYRVMFEKATVVFSSASGAPVAYLQNGGMETLKVQPAFAATNEGGGNISSLGGYFNELRYFADRLKDGQPMTRATLAEGVKSAELALRLIELAS